MCVIRLYLLTSVRLVLYIYIAVHGGQGAGASAAVAGQGGWLSGLGTSKRKGPNAMSNMSNLCNELSFIEPETRETERIEKVE